MASKISSKNTDRKYHLIDAQGKVLGRLATEIAQILSGKRKVDYAPHIDGGDFVVLINTDGIVVTGNKTNDKMYHRFSGYPGGINSINFKAGCSSEKLLFDIETVLMVHGKVQIEGGINDLI